MRRKVRSLALLASCLCFGNGHASAAILDLSGSRLELHFHGVLVATLPQSVEPQPVFVSSGAGSFVLPTGLFTHTGNLPTQLFTGIPLVSTMRLTMSNLSGTLAPGGGHAGGFGGIAPLTGGWALRIAGGCCFFPTTPLSVVGQGGVFQAAAAALMITVTGAPWTTGVARVTGVTFTTDSGFANTVSMTGSDARTAAHAGALRLVSPMRLVSNTGFPSTHFFVQNLVFVPEPATLLLLLAAATAAVSAGRRRP